MRRRPAEPLSDSEQVTLQSQIAPRQDPPGRVVASNLGYTGPPPLNPTRRHRPGQPPGL